MTDQTSVKRQRKSNFSVQEMDIIIDEVTLHGGLLFSSFSSTVTHQEKKKVWRAITDRINASCASNRTPDEIRKKWQDYRSVVKKKACGVRREGQKTGGGPAPTQLTDIEQKVVSTIPDCQITGIEAGVDTGLYGESQAAVAEMKVESGGEAAVPMEQPVQPVPENVTESSEPSSVASSRNIKQAVKSNTNEQKRKQNLISSAKSDTAEQFIKLKLQKLELTVQHHTDMMALKHRQVLALEEIAKSLKILTKPQESSENCVSPVIKLLEEMQNVL